MRQALRSDQEEDYGWNAIVLPSLTDADVSVDGYGADGDGSGGGGVVTVRLPMLCAGCAGYEISSPETIRLTVPAAALLADAPIVASGSIVVNASGGTLDFAGELSAGATEAELTDVTPRALRLVLSGDQWEGRLGQASFGPTLELLGGLRARGAEASGWASIVQRSLGASAVSRVDDETVELIIPQAAAYDIYAPEVIDAIVPATAVLSRQQPTLTAPLTILASAGRASLRQLRPGAPPFCLGRLHAKLLLPLLEERAAFAQPGRRSRGPPWSRLDRAVPFRLALAVLRRVLAEAVGTLSRRDQVDPALAAPKAAVSRAVTHALSHALSARRQDAFVEGVREGGLVAVAAAEVGSHPRLGELARRLAVVPADEELGVDAERITLVPSFDGSLEAGAEAEVKVVVEVEDTAAVEAVEEKLGELVEGTDAFGESFDVTAVAADITSEAGQAEALTAAGPIDILVTNAGGPPPGIWTDWSRNDFIAAFDANLLTPIALIKAKLPDMMDRGWGRIVNITSVAVKAPIPVLGLSNTARSGLTGYVAGVSRQVAGSGVTVNNLLPGLHDTDRLQMLDKVDAAAQGITEDAARAARTATIPAGRFGTVEEFGAACAWLCSDKAGFIIGQNILLDGGAFPGAM